MNQPNSDNAALELARARLQDALAAIVNIKSDKRVRLAYEHGYKAGLAGAGTSEDRVAYRRGYSAGYAAGRRGAPENPDGAQTGRPRTVVHSV